MLSALYRMFKHVRKEVVSHQNFDSKTSDVLVKAKFYEKENQDKEKFTLFLNSTVKKVRN